MPGPSGNDRGQPGLIPALSWLWRDPEHRRQWLQANGSAIAGFSVPFLLVMYLAMREGGYDQVARSELGIAVWLVVLLGALAGYLRIPQSRSAWIGIALLTALAAWTGLAALWSESADRTAIETARVATLLGIFALALCMQKAETLRHTIAGVGTAIALVGILSLSSRFVPELFPPNQVVEVLPTERARLGYPLAYWNGLATLMAIGMPLLLFGAGWARNLRLRALACAALPALALTSFLTLSRGGVVEAAIGLLALAVLMPKRLRIAAPAAIGGLGATVLIVLANSRAELSDGLDSDIARDQGLEMLLLTIAVCTLAALANFFAQRRLSAGWPSLPEMGRTRSLRLAIAGALVLVVGAIAVGIPGKIGDNWTEFKQPATPSGDTSRFQSASGSGRYQWWSSAADAGWSSPVVGIGPGSFEYWWARDDVEISGFVRDAHSLYLEAFGELGVVGLLLIASAVGGALGVGIRRVRRADSDGERAVAATATAAMLIFAAAAAIDWAWELTVLPVTFLLLAAALIGPGSNDPAGRARSALVLPLLAGVSLIAILPPMLTEIYIEDSQDAAGRGELVEAIENARSASAILPFDASSHLQQALVLQLGGDLDTAAAEARVATERESTNWRTWLVLSRIEADRGNEAAAELALEQSRRLNPRSLLFQEPAAPSG